MLIGEIITMKKRLFLFLLTLCCVVFVSVACDDKITDEDIRDSSQTEGQESIADKYESEKSFESENLPESEASAFPEESNSESTYDPDTKFY